MSQRPTPAKGTFPEDSNEELRLECARLASVFSEPGAVMDNAERMYRWIKSEQAREG